MLGKFIAGDLIAIADEMHRFPASNENTVTIQEVFQLSLLSTGSVVSYKNNSKIFFFHMVLNFALWWWPSWISDWPKKIKILYMNNPKIIRVQMYKLIGCVFDSGVPKQHWSNKTSYMLLIFFFPSVFLLPRENNFCLF